MNVFSQCFFTKMSEKFEVKRWDATSGYIFTSEKQHFYAGMNPLGFNQTTFSSKSGAVNDIAVEWFESQFMFSNKEVKKNGKEVFITYFCVEEKTAR